MSADEIIEEYAAGLFWNTNYELEQVLMRDYVITACIEATEHYWHNQLMPDEVTGRLATLWEIKYELTAMLEFAD